ncbi:MAG: DUF1178 family protein [Burkholderiaceae bacterium]|uniref:DUF1178 family protein n=1 Tax=Hydrogenophaga sp. TaxID=1904254 RepID=UPI0027247309|nr:DUF1178 family protein [Hydrogenophaga sp.]MDO8277553.1 DUF1178 family protein [Burkholderiaceae bacterium]MDO9030960.1 DUF1178 family protein [Hydrogenophaga sp.]MDP1967771.1 DUF1178 family protein [Burkholderiaceae bacterium]
MKVLDLQCAHQHAFEGWFASDDDFQDQLARGLVECPMCGDAQITKMLSAPRLNLGASRDNTAPEKDQVVSAPQDPALQKAWLRMVRHVMANTEDVGEKFAEEARRIHYGETTSRDIRGQASREETAALIEEGISVLPLPLPPALKGPLQ